MSRMRTELDPDDYNDEQVDSTHPAPSALNKGVPEDLGKGITVGR